MDFDLEDCEDLFGDSELNDVISVEDVQSARMSQRQSGNGQRRGGGAPSKPPQASRARPSDIPGPSGDVSTTDVIARGNTDRRRNLYDGQRAPNSVARNRTPVSGRNPAREGQVTEISTAGSSSSNANSRPQGFARPTFSSRNVRDRNSPALPHVSAHNGGRADHRGISRNRHSAQQNVRGAQGGPSINMQHDRKRTLPDSNMERGRPQTVAPKRRKKIPGPVGIFKESLGNSRNDPKQVMDVSRIENTQDSIFDKVEQRRIPLDRLADFRHGPWLKFCHVFMIKPPNAPSNYVPFPTLRVPPQYQSFESIRKGNIHEKVKFTAGVIVSYTESCDTGRVVLKDPTGTMKGSIASAVVNDMGLQLAMPGTVIVLKLVSLFVPSRDTFYLNITSKNVVRIIPASTLVPQEMVPFSKRPELPAQPSQADSLSSESSFSSAVGSRRYSRAEPVGFLSPAVQPNNSAGASSVGRLQLPASSSSAQSSAAPTPSNVIRRHENSPAPPRILVNDSPSGSIRSQNPPRRTANSSAAPKPPPSVNDKDDIQDLLAGLDDDDFLFTG